MKKTREKKLRKGDDMHLHLRQGKMMEDVIRHTVAQFSRAVIMPNTKPAIRDAEAAQRYKEEILAAAEKCSSGENFEPLMTIEITEESTPKMVQEASEAGVIAGKIYPRSQTTNSEDGMSTKGYWSEPMLEVYDAMEECGMLLLLHGEVPDYNILGRYRERSFLRILRVIAKHSPNLKIVLEHITSRESVEEVKNLPNVAATITVHHLLITQDDVIGYSEKSGGKMQPHLNCKPIAKDPDDKFALIVAATSGNPKFFYGGDSAPHPRDAKECAEVCAGIFNAPVAMPLLAQLFEENDALGKLEAFTSRFGAKWYDLPLNKEELSLARLAEDPLVVPDEYDGVVPFMAGQKLPWRVLKE